MVIQQCYELISKYEPQLSFLEFCSLCIQPNTVVYYNNNVSIVVIGYKLDSKTTEVHVYASKEARGKKCIKFLKELLEQDDSEVYYLPCTSKEAAQLAIMFGAKKINDMNYKLTKNRG